MRAIICDIDGTIANCNHRLHHVTGQHRDYDAFYEAMGEDLPIQPVIDLLSMIASTEAAILLSTGRPEKYRPMTISWLKRNGVACDEVYMRPDGDTRPDPIMKAQMLEGMRADGYEPFLVIDDRASVVKMWRDAGLVCLQAQNWEDRHDTEPGLLTLMVGPSGAGKTSFLESAAAWKYGIQLSHIISSDNTRNDLCGDFRDQSRNADVFRAVHAIARARIRNGLPVVIDATHLRRKDRLAAARLVPEGGKVRYIVIDRPDAEKRLDAGWRDALPIDLIAKHAATFSSQIKDILNGDDLPNVEVIDLRGKL